MKIGDIVYLTEPTRWRKTPDGDWDEYEYPIGTPLKVIGDSGFRGLDLEFVENGIKMLECAFVKFSTKNPLIKPESNSFNKMINNDLQNKLYACLPKNVRDNIKEQYNIHSTDDWNNGFDTCLVSYFGRHNLTSDTEPEEMLMVERKKVQEMYLENMETINETKEPKDCIEPDCVYARGTIYALSALFGDKCLPDKDISKMEITTTVNLSQNPAGNCDSENLNSNCDNMEEKELNLSELLKGCEGEKCYSIVYGNVTLEVIHTPEVDDPKYYLLIRPDSYSIGREIVHSNGKANKEGVVILYPSRALYEKYPLDAYSAWMEWKEARKLKYILEIEVSSWVDGEDGRENEKYDGKKWFKFDSAMELKQATEAVRECLEKFHEKNTEK